MTRFFTERFADVTTPCYYYDLDLLNRTLNEVKRATRDPRYKIHYAIKANANPGILRPIEQAGLGVDCVSGYEIARALEAGFDPSKIVFAGVGKSDPEILMALNAGIGCFNVESEPELRIISEMAVKLGKTATVAIRVNPNIDAHTHKYITTGLSENKFGINLEMLPAIVDLARSLPGVELSGLHFHIGSQITESEPWMLLCETVNRLQDEYRAKGITFRTINVGGGLGIDYAIIMCHHYTEERERMEPREATIRALTLAIPEISASSLTTISGLLALSFMKIKIGEDMSLVLIKAILFLMLTVFFLMPGLLLTFSKAIDGSHHRSFVPKITAVGKFCVLTRFIVPPLLVVAVIAAFILSSKANYAYDVNSLSSSRMSDNKFSVSMVNKEFGEINQLAVIVPNGDYEREAKALDALSRLDEVNSCMGLANIEAMDGYMLTQQLTPRQFSEMIDMDVEVADLLYSAYALDQSNYGALVSGVSDYKVPLIDMFLFIYDQKENGNITLDDDLEETLTDAYSQISIAKDQLLGEDDSRFVLELNVPLEGEETTAALEKIRDTVARYYSVDDILLVGNSTSDKDLGASFATDNTIITVLTALFVMIILLFTFQSAGLPVLLVVTIQGSIWMNFSLPYLLNEPVYFLGYLVVSAIQMGATIDYAIVIASRYMDLKTYMPIKEAAIEALNQAFPTIVTSGSMLVAAGFIISNISSNAAVAAIGLALGRGTLTSILLVLLALPQTLLIGDIIIQKTAFTLKRDLAKPLPSKGRIRMSGHIRGYVNGVIDGEFTGVIDGEMGAVVRPRDTVQKEAGNEDTEIIETDVAEIEEKPEENTAESEAAKDEK